MRVSLIYKVSPILCLTLSSYFMPPLHSSALAFPVRHLFGIYGKPGANGEDQTIFATGYSISIDISGKDGEDGGDGASGTDGDCSKPREEKKKSDNRVSQSGGNGSDGHDGGNGGDGGSLTVYYQNLEDLKQIYVRADGGEGGRGGRGGRGGTGCNGGINGNNGISGRDGRRGKLGKLFIINRSESLPEAKPQLQVKIGELRERSVKVSQNIWKFREGANRLLASGSTIDDLYQEFDRQIERSVGLVVPSSSDLNYVENETVTVSLSNSGKVALNFPDEVLIKGNLVEDENTANYVVERAISKTEATKLQISQVELSSSQKRLTLVDRASKSDLVETKFKLIYQSKDPAVRFNQFNRDRYDFKTIYRGDIPSEAVKSDRRNFTIDISQIPIPSEYLQSKVPAKIELVAIRSLGDTSTEQKISWEGEISAR